MTTRRETIEKPKKKNKLRYNEYYNTQEEQDKLYQRSKKGHDFKDLLSKIAARKNILLAYRTIKNNKGSKTKGVNNTTIENIGNWTPQQLVEYVRKRLEYYIPQPVRRVYIEKDDGRKRPLGIPTIEDRLVQQSIRQILNPIVEAKFHKHSYGFRTNRGTKHAIARCMFLMNQANFYFTVDLDIKGFFDNVDHGKLLKQLWTMGIKDKNLISIISRMLRAEIKGEGIPEKGIPQGGVISSLLSNVVLNELDWWIFNQWETLETDYKYAYNSNKYSALKHSNLKEMFIVRYADDLKIFCRTYEEASKIKIAITGWLKERLNLEISKRKTKITNLKTSYSEFLGIKFKVIQKGNNYICKSRISKDVKSKIACRLKRQIKSIQKNPESKEVLKLNSMILGMHLYYSMATYISKDFKEVAFQVNRTLINRLKTKANEKGAESKAYTKFYGTYNYKTYSIAGVRIFPVAGIKTKPP